MALRCYGSSILVLISLLLLLTFSNVAEVHFITTKKKQFAIYILYKPNYSNLAKICFFLILVQAYGRAKLRPSGSSVDIYACITSD